MRIPNGGIFFYLAAIECYKFIMHYAEKCRPGKLIPLVIVRLNLRSTNEKERAGGDPPALQKYLCLYW
jgi:hypothetical protein